MKNWKHQDIAIERFSAKEFFGLLFDCGTGKTRTAIQISFKKDRNTTVIAPKNTVKQWRESLIASGVPKEDIFILNNAKLKTKKGLKEFRIFLEGY